MTSPEPVMISLVLRLREGAAVHAATLAALRGHPGLALGEVRGSWIPVVAETPDPHGLHRWLEALPGVQLVDVTFVEIVPQSGTSPGAVD